MFTDSLKWHSGAEKCTSWYLPYIVFQDLYCIVLLVDILPFIRTSLLNTLTTYNYSSAFSHDPQQHYKLYTAACFGKRRHPQAVLNTTLTLCLAHTRLTVQCLLTVPAVRSDTQLSPSCMVQEDPVPVGVADITVHDMVRAVLLLVLPEHGTLVPKHVTVCAVCNATMRSSCQISERFE